MFNYCAFIEPVSEQCATCLKKCSLMSYTDLPFNPTAYPYFLNCKFLYLGKCCADRDACFGIPSPIQVVASGTSPSVSEVHSADLFL